MQELIFETYADLCLNQIVPQAEYFGVLTSEASYGKLNWRDSRPKPTWAEIEAQWPAVKAELQRQLYKETRSDVLLKAHVEVDGLSFNADEAAQDRMLRAIWYMEEYEVPAVDWYTYDNVKTSVPLTTMKQALKLACENQSSIWFGPSED